jgi:uncharacterized membrane protein YoaK (UPF0700 family)
MQRIFDLASPERTASRDRALGATLAFVAGATNAGGYLAVGQYTSHMTGVVSALAEDIASSRFTLAWAAVGTLLAFVTGAMTTALSVNWARQHRLRSCYAIPLLIEAVLLLAFGLLGNMLAGYEVLVAPLTVLVLCYLMGLQNAVITKVSSAVIRTTHVTGLVTDMGIELGRLVYINRKDTGFHVHADRGRLAVHVLLFMSFLAGGLAGAFGFRTIGYVATLPLAALLLLLGCKPLVQDLSGAD